MSITFQVVDSGEGVFSSPDKRFFDAVARLDELLDDKETKRLSLPAYCTQLAALVAAEPDFIDGHAHLGYAWYEQGKYKKALEACLKGLSVGNKLIPENFFGEIPWGYLDNRPFLRSLHGVILASSRLRKHKDAAILIEKLLTYNPHDNQGARYLLGSELLRTKDAKSALAFLTEDASNYPPHYYEQALWHLQTNNLIDAATALRRGFCANPYIAEIICGNYSPRSLAVWHGSSMNGTPTANNYLSMYGALWYSQAEFPAFVHWLFNHPAVLTERAAVLACREALHWEKSPEQRSSMLARLDELENQIDDQLSHKIVIRRKDRRGHEVYPWESVMEWPFGVI